MTLEELRRQVADGTVDTVVPAMTDVQGRLQGKRLHAAHVLDEVLEHGAEACNLAAFESAVTDRERVRGFERL